MIDLVWAGESDPETRDAISAWAAGIIFPGEDQNFGPCVCLGAFKSGEIIGCVIFNNYNPNARTIEFSMASTSRRWLTLRLMEEMRRYCLDQLGSQMVMAKTKVSNHHISEQLRSYGFDEYRIPRLYGRDEDGLIFTITAEQAEKSAICRRSRNGRT